MASMFKFDSIGKTAFRVLFILAVFTLLIYLGQNRLIFFPFKFG